VLTALFSEGSSDVVDKLAIVNFQEGAIFLDHIKQTVRKGIQDHKLR
jgi:hypothetical protein